MSGKQTLNAAHDYSLQLSKDERRYQRLNDTWLDVHECTFPIEMLSGNRVVADDFNICDTSVTFRVPFTKGTGWNRGSINEKYKDGPNPRYESRTFPLWQKIWLQYKLDDLHDTCDDYADYKRMLDQNNMRDKNDLLLWELMQMIGSYNADFCSCDVGTTGVGAENDPWFIEVGSSALSDILFRLGEGFQVECLPYTNYITLLPLCHREAWIKDQLIKDQFTQCCANASNPLITGMMPDMFSSVNGVSVVFLRDEFFDKKVMGDGTSIAYKIPTFSADAIAYQPALLKYSEIGEDKTEDGNHYRWQFFYSMNVVLPEAVRNDWMVFKKQPLPTWSSQQV